LIYVSCETYGQARKLGGRRGAWPFWKVIRPPWT